MKCASILASLLVMIKKKQNLTKEKKNDDTNAFACRRHTAISGYRQHLLANDFNYLFL